MTYTTTVNRDALKNLNIPVSMKGSLFRVTVTAIDDDDPTVVSFRGLKGIAGCELSLDEVKGERLHETAD